MVLAHYLFHWWCQWCSIIFSFQVHLFLLASGASSLFFPLVVPVMFVNNFFSDNKIKFSFRRLTNTFLFSFNQFPFSDLFQLKSAEECLPGIKVPMCGEFRLKRAEGCLSGLKAPTCCSIFGYSYLPGQYSQLQFFLAPRPIIVISFQFLCT